jgi:ribosome biogenesis GTPase A
LDGVAVLEAVAKKRGCVVQGRRGGDLDLEKATMVLLADDRAGKFGRVTLESPQSRAAMLKASSTFANPASNAASPLVFK